MTLSPDQRNRYRNDGFVALEQFVRGHDLARLLDRVDHFITTIVPGMPPERVFYENKTDRSTLKQIQHMDEHDRWFRQLFTAGRFRDVAETLLDGPVVPTNLQYFNKPPSIGQPTPPHQDGYYFMLDPCKAVTMWLALEDVDEETGCVRYVRGSHLTGMRRHARTETLGFSQGIVGYPSDSDRRNEVVCPAKAGDTLAHDALTIHRADRNQSSTRSRRALGFIYFSAHAREDTAAKKTYQQRLAQEMRSQGKI